MEEVNEGDLIAALREALDVVEIVDAPDALTVREMAELLKIHETVVRRRLENNPKFERVNVIRKRSDGRAFRVAAWRLKDVS